MTDTSPTAALQQAARVAAHSAIAALGTAATNAAQPGATSSELKVTVAGIALTAVLAGLDVLGHVPGPWMVPALALSAAIAAGAYAISRGSVKVAALQAAAAAVQVATFGDVAAGAGADPPP